MNDTYKSSGEIESKTPEPITAENIPADTAAIRAALEAANEWLPGPGPWTFQPWSSCASPSGDYAESILFDSYGEELTRGLPDEVGYLLVEAPTWLAALCDEVERLGEGLRVNGIVNARALENLMKQDERLLAERDVLRARLEAAEKALKVARRAVNHASTDNLLRLNAALDAYHAETEAGE